MLFRIATGTSGISNDDSAALLIRDQHNGYTRQLIAQTRWKHSSPRMGRRKSAQRQACPQAPPWVRRQRQHGVPCKGTGRFDGRRYHKTLGILFRLSNPWFRCPFRATRPIVACDPGRRSRTSLPLGSFPLPHSGQNTVERCGLPTTVLDGSRRILVSSRTQ